MARSWFMGFAKKLGQTFITEYHPLNPLMKPIGPGSRLKSYVCAHGERLIEGTLAIENRITPSELASDAGTQMQGGFLLWGRGDIQKPYNHLLGCLSRTTAGILNEVLRNHAIRQAL
jgi:hypothetical protein